MNNPITKPALTVSLKKPSIRIYKETLHLIGNPEYVLLSVNFADNTLVITPSITFDAKAHNVGKYLKNSSKSVVLYSTPLIRSLQQMSGDWQTDKAYRMYGQLALDKKCVQFKLADAISIN